MQAPFSTGINPQLCRTCGTSDAGFCPPHAAEYLRQRVTQIQAIQVIEPAPPLVSTDEMLSAYSVEIENFFAIAAEILTDSMPVPACAERAPETSAWNGANQ